MIYDCIVVGAGASGLFFGASISNPLNGLILEKTKKAGTKLLMSGSGHCNITHAGSVKEFIPHYGSCGPKIRSCLYKHSNIKLQNFLIRGGVNIAEKQDGRVFPSSMNAYDILRLLLNTSEENGFEIKYECAVKGIEKYGNVWKVITLEEAYLAKTVVIASGGCSYPQSGSDGSMLEVLKRDLNIEIVTPKAALCPVSVCEYPYGELSGISFDNIQISVWKDGKKTAQKEGGLLLTHNCLSGPAVLNISKYVEETSVIKINYVYPLKYEEVLNSLKHSVNGTNAALCAVISESFGLPKRFCESLVDRYGCSLKTLSKCLTEEEFNALSDSDFTKAMVTCGGVALSQLDTSNMQLTNHHGVYVIGEACDVDGETGGYNLQFAYSSACAAADSVISQLLQP